ncbi:MAG: lasso RiPP family leader peptide-containing protein [Desulfobulbaceae bacterium]|nr:lasso RiPP family leader peptide-containing protein [Desulfobulbaceae bacterium]
MKTSIRKNENKQKKSWVKPVLTIHGDFTKITLGGNKPPGAMDGYALSTGWSYSIS